MKIGDFHIHSKNSDGLNDVRDIIKVAYKKGLNCIAITDHNKITKLDKYREISKKYGVELISGVEIKSNLGDILLLFIDKIPKTKDAFEIIDFARENNSIVILPHPYRDHKKIEKIAKYVDFIEINQRDHFINQMKAIKLALKIKKCIIANSDAHLLREVGSFRNKIIEEDTYESLLKGKVKPLFSKKIINSNRILYFLKKKFSL